MKKVVILGGSFDPIHDGHLSIAKKTKEYLKANEIWLLVAKNPRWKSDFTDASIRLEMIKLAIKGSKDIKICTTELEDTLSEVTYTIDTALTLQYAYPDYKFYFIIGSDQLAQLHLWKNIEELANIFQFVLVTRPGVTNNQENIDKFKIIVSDVIGPDVSSTNIRLGKQIDGIEAVNSYIKENGLYLDEQLKASLSEKRYLHSINVANLAKQIASKNHLNQKKAYIAGILHDCAKEISKTDTLDMMKKYFPNDLNHSVNVYHQFLGTIIAKEKYGITDEEILEAIKYHATSSNEISNLGKVIYCADKIDPSRGYDSNALIDLCIKNYEFGYYKILEDNIKYIEMDTQTKNFDELSNKALEKALREKEMSALKIVVKSLDGRKGNNIVVIDVQNKCSYTNYIVICDGSNDRQCAALCHGVEDDLENVGYNINRIEGKNGSTWYLVDAYDIIVHIFNVSERKKYNIEKMHADMPLIDIETLI